MERGKFSLSTLNSVVHLVPEVVEFLIFLCNFALDLSPYLLQLHLKSQGFALLMLQSTLSVGGYSGLVTFGWQRVDEHQQQVG